MSNLIDYIDILQKIEGPEMAMKRVSDLCSGYSSDYNGKDFRAYLENGLDAVVREVTPGLGSSQGAPFEEDFGRPLTGWKS